MSEPFGVYIHWPFCLSKCPYCDFNSHVRAAAIDQPRYAAAFEAEIASTAARIGARTVSTISSKAPTSIPFRIVLVIVTFMANSFVKTFSPVGHP